MTAASKPTQRPTRELPLLLLAAVLVCTICVPLWQYSANEQTGSAMPLTGERLLQMFFGPEQIACYCCFAWGGFILFSRWLELRRQRRAFGLELLPTEEGARILPEDARLLIRKTEQLSARGGPYILSNMIRLGLNKYAVTRSPGDVTDVVRTQADVEMSRFVSTMSTVHFLAWAIPALGFLGTVRGLGMSLSTSDMEATIRSLNVAFDTTLVALTLSMPLMFLLHTLQRDEEGLVLDCQEYCLNNLVARLYHPGVETPAAPVTAPDIRLPGRPASR